MAPPADKPVTKMRAGSMPNLVSISAIICRIEWASPRSRPECSSKYQLKQRLGLFDRCCSGNKTASSMLARPPFPTSGALIVKSLRFGCSHGARQRGVSRLRMRLANGFWPGASPGSTRTRRTPPNSPGQLSSVLGICEARLTG